MRDFAAANPDLVSGWRLSVTLSRRTPLEWLLRHGEHSAQPTDVPMQHGIWIIRTKSWRELGFDIDELHPSTMASEIGQIAQDGGDFLPFLVAYRTIVEAQSSDDDTFDALTKLGEAYPAIQEALGGDIARAHVLDDLMMLPGCGPKTAKSLFEHGFRSSEAVRATSPDVLRTIVGIGAKTAVKLTS
jgi:predicted flap endonuclease-1-like 5' DNA nuclease